MVVNRFLKSPDLNVIGTYYGFFFQNFNEMHLAFWKINAVLAGIIDSKFYTFVSNNGRRVKASHEKISMQQRNK